MPIVRSALGLDLTILNLNRILQSGERILRQWHEITANVVYNCNVLWMEHVVLFKPVVVLQKTAEIADRGTNRLHLRFEVSNILTSPSLV